jgi:GNAT superfamily N-acetyltransferase
MTEYRYIYLTLESLGDIPDFDLPVGYSIETLGMQDLDLWYSLQREAEPYLEIYDGLLEEQFDTERDELGERCHLLMCGKEVVGTGIAWWEPDVLGERWGVLRWFAIHPAHQGKGLSKPLLTRILKQIRETDDKCYLTTSPERTVAIRLYLDFGFRPKYVSEPGRKIWAEIAGQIDHPALSYLREAQ